jgi:phospholipid N-methyltransferase
MVEGLRLCPGDVILEYGPGTGSFSAVVEEWMDGVPGVRYLGIERDPEFYQSLCGRFPRMEFVNAPVEEVQRLIAERGMAPPRVILSGLPLIFMPTMPRIIRCAGEILAPGGAFRTFSYLQSLLTPSSGRVRSAMRANFDRVELSRLVARNFPPAFVLKGDKRGGEGAH